MVDSPTSELMYEILKKIQDDVAYIKARADSHDQQFIGLREQLHNQHRSLQTQIHDLQGDALRLEKGQAAMLRDLDRIKRRLELADAE